MDHTHYDLELASYDSHIALADLEVAKAEERSRELRFRRAQFILQAKQLEAKQGDIRLSQV